VVTSAELAAPSQTEFDRVAVLRAPGAGGGLLVVCVSELAVE
jgi:hypothetical protein